MLGVNITSPHPEKKRFGSCLHLSFRLDSSRPSPSPERLSTTTQNDKLNHDEAPSGVEPVFEVHNSAAAAHLHNPSEQLAGGNRQQQPRSSSAGCTQSKINFVPVAVTGVVAADCPGNHHHGAYLLLIFYHVNFEGLIILNIRTVFFWELRGTTEIIQVFFCILLDRL